MARNPKCWKEAREIPAISRAVQDAGAPRGRWIHGWLSDVGQPERATQTEVAPSSPLWTLGYRYLVTVPTFEATGSNDREGLRTAYLARSSYPPPHKSAAPSYKLRNRSGQPQPHPLREHHPLSLLRYSCRVKNRGRKGDEDRPPHHWNTGEKQLRIAEKSRLIRPYRRLTRAMSMAIASGG